MEDTLTRVHFESGYAVESADLVLFVPKTYSDAHPGAECGIAPALPFLHLEQTPGDDSKSDYGGIVQLDGDGRLYVDVVLPNQRDATETHLTDAWADLEATAAYTICLRKAPSNAVQRRRSLRHRQRILTEWWADGSTDDWTHLGGDFIHVLDPDQPPSAPPAPPSTPPAPPSPSPPPFPPPHLDPIHILPLHTCEGYAGDPYLYGSSSDGERRVPRRRVHGRVGERVDAQLAPIRLRAPRRARPGHRHDRALLGVVVRQRPRPAGVRREHQRRDHGVAHARAQLDVRRRGLQRVERAACGRRVPRLPRAPRDVPLAAALAHAPVAALALAAALPAAAARDAQADAPRRRRPSLRRPRRRDRSRRPSRRRRPARPTRCRRRRRRHRPSPRRRRRRRPSRPTPRRRRRRRRCRPTTRRLRSPRRRRRSSWARARPCRRPRPRRRPCRRPRPRRRRRRPRRPRRHPIRPRRRHTRRRQTRR